MPDVLTVVAKIRAAKGKASSTARPRSRSTAPSPTDPEEIRHSVTD